MVQATISIAKTGRLIKIPIPRTIFLLSKCNLSNPDNVSLENNNYSKGDSQAVDQKWSVGLTKGEEQLDGTIKVVHINEVKSGKIKTFEEARGSVISNYQDYLESSWKKDLEEKYPAIIFKDVLYSLTK